MAIAEGQGEVPPLGPLISFNKEHSLIAEMLEPIDVHGSRELHV